MRVISDSKKPIKIWASELEAEAEQQLRNLATLPFIYNHVAVMPDAHAGKGSTVGTVIATRGAIIPAAVGVDIGCGMMAVKLPFKIDVFSNLSKLRHSIERAVPTGRNGNKEVSKYASSLLLALGTPTEASGILPDSRTFKNALLQCGSLGGGNHFIELCFDKENNAWIMLHSGSRNIGKCLAEVHIDKAKGIMKSYFIDLPDPDLAYLARNTPEFDNYIKDLMWAQGFAKANRKIMMAKVLREVFYELYGSEWSSHINPEQHDLFTVDCHHNYTNIEHHNGDNVYVTRKGAVSAKLNEYGIIPGSMGVQSYIVKGLGNPDSFHSCSHGAGRKMSRTKARAQFSKADLESQTEGVECRKDEGVIDEIPGAYKDINQVMKDQSDLVEPVYELKQVLCIKG